MNGYGVDSYFNPDYLEVDRVLDVRIVQEDTSIEIDEESPDLEALCDEKEYGRKGIFTKEFLIKWKNLPYCDISWECFDDFQDKECIDLFYLHEYDLSLLMFIHSFIHSLTL